jgi:[acyl-carrier-protein] S-malonyltransferase
MSDVPQLAFVFSPQGSQTPGMGKDLHDNLSVCREVFDRANETLGFDLSAICFSGSEDDLRNTEIAQPALLTTSVAALRALQSEGFNPSVVAGHSVGEYAALVAAGALEFEDALRLVRRRGQLMSEAGARMDGAMAAIIGLPSDEVKKLVVDAAGTAVLDVANYNSPEQTVISGERSAVDRACEMAKERGAKRALPLNVSGAFHSRLMAPAAEQMEQELARTNIQAPETPIVANVVADFVTSPEEIRGALTRQLAGSVRWVESVQKITGGGCKIFVEAGIGKALVGMINRIDREAEAFAVSDCASLKAFVEQARTKD